MTLYTKSPFSPSDPLPTHLAHNGLSCPTLNQKQPHNNRGVTIIEVQAQVCHTYWNPYHAWRNTVGN